MDNKNSAPSNPKVQVCDQKFHQFLELPSVIISEGRSTNGVTEKRSDLKNIESQITQVLTEKQGVST